MASQRVSPQFRTLIDDAEAGNIIIPPLRTYLYNPKFKPFTVSFKAFEGREPDGWFHPSTHPTWPERMLYYYLAQPHRMIPEPMDPSSTLAVTVGHFWHSFLETCLVDLGVFDKSEVYVEDRVTGARGYMDGIASWGVGEIKTCHPQKIKTIDAATYREKNPEYYGQAQDYMRLSGKREHRTLFIVPQYPFHMKEILLTYDPMYAQAVETKYLRVRQAVADQTPPPACCAPRSAEAKVCPARAVCPIGMV